MWADARCDELEEGRIDGCCHPAGSRRAAAEAAKYASLH